MTGPQYWHLGVGRTTSLFFTRIVEITKKSVDQNAKNHQKLDHAFKLARHSKTSWETNAIPTLPTSWSPSRAKAIP